LNDASHALLNKAKQTLQSRISIHRTTHYLILAIIFWYIAVSPFKDTFSSIWSLYDEKRAQQLLLIYLTLGSTICFRSLRNYLLAALSQLQKTTIVLIAITIVAAIISASFSTMPIYAYTELLTVFGLSITSLLIAGIVLSHLEASIKALIISTYIFVTIFEIEFITSYIAALIVDGTIDPKLLFPHFGNVRFFNQFQIWTIPLVLAPLIMPFCKDRRVIVSLYFITGLWITILLTSQSRGALIAFLLGLILTTTIFINSGGKNILKVSLRAILVGIAIYFLIFLIIPNLIFASTDLNTRTTRMTEMGLKNVNAHERLSLWKRSLDYIESNPLAGIGPMHYAYEENAHAHPHNGALQIASEYGLIVFTCAAIIFLGFITRWISTIYKLTSPAAEIYKSKKNIINYHFLFFFSLTSGLSYSMVSGVFVMPMAQTMLAIIFGYSMGIIFSAANPSFNLYSSLVIQMACGLVLIGLTFVITPHLTTRILNPFFATHIPQVVSGPRYWELGGLQQAPSRIQPFYYEHPSLKAPDLRSFTAFI
jgi:putative inorganic carbon (HCO3(-)) transporter